MNIFNDNNRLQDLTMYALDWAVFLRHDMTGQIAPFMFLQHGDDLYKRVLITDGNPVEYAVTILATEQKPYDQFVIGFEGYIHDEKNERSDALIVQGFDKTQPKGVSLAQAFIPKEQGAFERIGKVSFVDTPDLPIDLVTGTEPDYSVEELGFTGMNVSQDNLIVFRGFFTHKNPSVIADGMKRYLRGKLSDANSQQSSGKFSLLITPGLGSGTEFLKYTVLSALQGELQSELVKQWEATNKRKVIISCAYGDELWMGYDAEAVNSTAGSLAEGIAHKNEEDKDKLKSIYDGFSEVALVQEFHRIMAIPGARTNVVALKQMSVLMDVFKQKGLSLPGAEAPIAERTTSNASTIRIFIVLIIIVVLYFIFRSK